MGDTWWNLHSKTVKIFKWLWFTFFFLFLFVCVCMRARVLFYFFIFCVALDSWNCLSGILGKYYKAGASRSTIVFILGCQMFWTSKTLLWIFVIVIVLNIQVFEGNCVIEPKVLNLWNWLGASFSAAKMSVSPCFTSCPPLPLSTVVVNCML